MRSLIVMTMFAASLSYAAWNGYTEDRELELDADGVEQLEIEAGAGTLVVTGDASLDAIKVIATINVPDRDADDALEIIDESLTLSLDKDRDEARLKAWFESQGWSMWRDSPWVDLDVRVPHGIALDVDDSSGSVKILQTHSDVIVDDSSGSIQIEDAKSVVVDDGSGSIRIENVEGDVEIDDGSGSITVEHVGGSVRVDDGSGSITVNDIEHDVIIIDDGSGGLNASNVRGVIDNDS